MAWWQSFLISLFGTLITFVLGLIAWGIKSWISATMKATHENVRLGEKIQALTLQMEIVQRELSKINILQKDVDYLHDLRRILEVKAGKDSKPI